MTCRFFRLRTPSLPSVSLIIDIPLREILACIDAFSDAACLRLHHLHHPARRPKSIRSIHNLPHAPSQCTMLSTQFPPLSSPIAIIVSSHDRFRRLHRSTHGFLLLLHASMSGRCALALRSVSHQSASFRSSEVSCLPLLSVQCYIVSRVIIVVYIRVHLPFPPVCSVPSSPVTRVHALSIHYRSTYSWPPCVSPSPSTPLANLMFLNAPPAGAPRTKDGVQPSAAPLSVRRLPYYYLTYGSQVLCVM